ncbi:MAG: hypothetical protein EOP51_32810 [Sphingobacteriales bacterium]|nr:MAG: hypothetical protein EOP51_32810 [Sphingobacteriales bacterium]
MKEKDLQSELSDLRSLMDRSTKFISLSGLSAMMAGIYALAGIALAWFLIIQSDIELDQYSSVPAEITDKLAIQIYIIAVVVLVASVLTAVWLTSKKVAKRGEKVWNAARMEVLGKMLTPLIAGGLLMNVFIFKGDYQYVASVSLVFYGLALVAGSYYTLSLIKYLGYFQIVLGLIAAIFPYYGLFFWIGGFGILHIIYGSILHFKYER